MIYPYFMSIFFTCPAFKILYCVCCGIINWSNVKRGLKIIDYPLQHGKLKMVIIQWIWSELKMDFRKAAAADINQIMEIIRQAQEYLRMKGIDQWQNNYPDTCVIRNDIEGGNGYVLDDGRIITGTVSVFFGGEETYNYIEGKWLSDNDYAAVHRIAVRKEYKGKGLASVMLENIEHMCLDKGIHSIKIDTHEKNIPMRKLLQKNGFTYCGVIYLKDGSRRMAFEKLI